MGQIKNIKLHIVTDIKYIVNNGRFRFSWRKRRRSRRWPRRFWSRRKRSRSWTWKGKRKRTWTNRKQGMGSCYQTGKIGQGFENQNNRTNLPLLFTHQGGRNHRLFPWSLIERRSFENHACAEADQGRTENKIQAFVAIGDYDGHVGLGVKCAKEVATAIRGAITQAKL